MRIHKDYTIKKQGMQSRKCLTKGKKFGNYGNNLTDSLSGCFKFIKRNLLSISSEKLPFACTRSTKKRKLELNQIDNRDKFGFEYCKMKSKKNMFLRNIEPLMNVRVLHAKIRCFVLLLILQNVNTNRSNSSI